MKQTIGQEFMSMTKIEAQSDREKKLPPPPPELSYDPNAQVIRLPEPDFLDDCQVNFLELVELRTSVRNYRAAHLTKKELSYLLWCTQGVKMASGATTKRNVPSAGARHAFETYLYLRQAEDLAQGLYRFLALEHALIPIDLSGEVALTMEEAFRHQAMLKKCAAAFIWTAVAERMTCAYGQRGYRYLFLDAGHVCQNLYLAAQTIQAGACAIAHFDDDKLNQALNIDGKAQFAIYAASVGK